MCDAYLLCKTTHRTEREKTCALAATYTQQKTQIELKRYRAEITFSCRCKWDNIQDPTINGGHLNAHIEYINYIKYSCYRMHALSLSLSCRSALLSFFYSWNWKRVETECHKDRAQYPLRAMKEWKRRTRLKIHQRAAKQMQQKKTHQTKAMLWRSFARDDVVLLCAVCWIENIHTIPSVHTLRCVSYEFCNFTNSFYFPIPTSSSFFPFVRALHLNRVSLIYLT